MRPACTHCEDLVSNVRRYGFTIHVSSLSHSIPTTSVVVLLNEIVIRICAFDCERFSCDDTDRRQPANRNPFRREHRSSRATGVTNQSSLWIRRAASFFVGASEGRRGGGVGCGGRRRECRGAVSCSTYARRSATVLVEHERGDTDEVRCLVRVNCLVVFDGCRLQHFFLPVASSVGAVRVFLDQPAVVVEHRPSWNTSCCGLLPHLALYFCSH